MKIIRLLKHELAGDATLWVEKGIVSREQAESVLSLYGTSYPTGDKRSLGYFILLAVAALFVGISILILIGHNWAEIPRAVRMGGLIALTLAFHVAGLFQLKKDNMTAATIWSFLGCLTYGTSIFLIAQIYHLGEHFPNGIFYWGLGILPFALIMESTLLFLFLAVIANLWMLTETGMGNFPTLFPLFILPMFYHCFKVKSSILTFLIAVVSSIVFGEISLSLFTSEGYPGFHPGVEHVIYTAAVFILLDVVGKWMLSEKYSTRVQEYGLTLRVWSLRAAAIALVVFSFDEPWRSFFRGTHKELALVGSITATTVAAFVALLAAQTVTLAERVERVVINNLSGIAFLCLFVVGALSAILTKDIYHTGADVMQIITNVFLLGTGARLVIRGFEEHASSSYYFGVALILLTAFLRYIDLIGNYIGGSIMFMLAGVAMYSAARFWKYHAEKEAVV